MAGLQDLITMAKGGSMAPAPAAGPSPDVMAQLAALIGGNGGMAPAGANPMLQAVAAKMGGGGGSYPPSYAPVKNLKPNENDQYVGGPGNPTDRDLANMNASGDGGLVAFEDQFGVPARSPGGPVSEQYDRGMDGQLLNADVRKRNANKAGVPNQAMMDSNVMSNDAYQPTGKERRGQGPYVNKEADSRGGVGDPVGDQLDRQQGASGKKAMSTEEELDMVHKKISQDPSDNGDFPTQKEIDALNSGKIDPKEFDAKWGKGAAKEMMDNGDDDADDGDHEYR